MKRYKAGLGLLCVGTVLILSALLLFLHNLRESTLAGQSAEWNLAGVQRIIVQHAQADKPEAERGQQEAAPAEPEPEPIVVDGYAYIGYLTLPSLELELPVMAEWDYDRLQIAPCRQFGTVGTRDLVIAAHNYESHFGRLKELQPDDSLYFTDTRGTVHPYTVSRLETLTPREVGSVENSGYDLVLYTCTIGGQARVIAFCNQIVGSQTRAS